MADKRLPREVSVEGTAAYAWFNKKDTKFAKGGEEGKYKGTLVVQKAKLADLKAGVPDKAGKIVWVSGTEWIEHIQDLHSKAVDSVAKYCPVKDGDKPRGKKKEIKEEFKDCLTIDFKSKYKPQMVDAKKKDLPEGIWAASGDLIRISYRPVLYEGGVSLQMNAVQVLEKRARGGGADLFDEEEGYEAPDQADTPFSGDGDAVSGGSDDNPDY
jgi:hypothetical protein